MPRIKKTKNSAVLKSLNDIPLKSLKNQRVLLRADLNVPVGNDGVIDGSEDRKIKAILPTIKYLLKRNAKIILLSHLGRPKISRKFIKSIKSLQSDSGQAKVHKVESSEYSLRPAANRMEDLLKIKIKFVDDCIGDKARKAAEEMVSGEIMLLENLRFYKEEEENNEKFAKALASLGDIYINDAFADCHRKHSSIVGITKFLPSYAGLLLEKEIESMEKFYKPKHPAIAIIGGAKIETKLPAVEALAKIYDYVLVGGMIANRIIKNPKNYIVNSNVILPDEKSVLREKGYDIGAVSVKKFANLIKSAKTIIWNGPMGMFEEKKYSLGTRGVISAIKIARKKGAKILIGGGETIMAFQKFAPELMDKKIMDSTHSINSGQASSPQENFNISTGGGAMLEFLAGKKLPGVEALLKSNLFKKIA